MNLEQWIVNEQAPNPWGSSAARMQDGAILEYSPENFLTLGIFLNKPTVQEIETIKKSPIETACFRSGAFWLSTLRFQDWKSFSFEINFDIWKFPPAYDKNKAMEDIKTKNILIIAGITIPYGTLFALRMVTIPHGFSDSLFCAIKEQLHEKFSFTAKYDQWRLDMTRFDPDEIWRMSDKTGIFGEERKNNG